MALVAGMLLLLCRAGYSTLWRPEGGASSHRRRSEISDPSKVKGDLYETCYPMKDEAKILLVKVVPSQYG